MTDPTMPPCEAIIGEFVFGPQQCNQASVVAVTCEDWPCCDRKHPVCAEHSASWESASTAQTEER